MTAHRHAAPSMASLLVGAEDEAYLKGDAHTWQQLLAYLSSRVSEELDPDMRAEASAFVDRLRAVVGGCKRLEALRDMIVDIVETGPTTEAALVPISQAVEALGQAVSSARAEARDMKRSLWRSLPDSDRRRHVAWLESRLEFLRSQLAEVGDAEGLGKTEDELLRTAEILRSRREQDGSVAAAVG